MTAHGDPDLIGAKNAFTIEDVRAFWDSIADEYLHESESLADAHFQRFDRAFAHFQPRDGSKALNVWSRNGEAVAYFRRLAPNVELVNAEVSPRLIQQAQARHPQEVFVQTDLVPLEFPDEEFDFVLSLETLEHAPDPLGFLLELRRVLKPGGRLVLSCPPASAELPLRIYERLFPNHGEGPHRFLRSREVKRLLHAAGLKVLCHESTLFLPVGPRWLRRLDPIVERVVARTPLAELGIRQFYVCQRRQIARPGYPSRATVHAAGKRRPATAQGDSRRSWRDLIRDVVATDLCTRCGTCVGVCPSGVLEIAPDDEDCLPAAVRPDACARCGLCREVCPGREVSFAAVRAAAADAPIRSDLLGPVRRIRAVHARDPEVRRAGASGGAVTAILRDLLARGEITGAVVLDAHPDFPWRPWPRIARAEEEILRAAQSKYCATPTNVVLRQIEADSDRLAVVALPCQIHAWRTLERRGHPALRAVRLIVGLYCGNQLHFGATRSFLRRHGVRDVSEVAAIHYRDGPWPGSVRCRLRDGRTFAVPKFHFNQLISSYVVGRCLLCADLASEGADLSAADAWDAPAEDGGWSLLVSRTARGEAVASEMVARGVLRAEEIELDRAVAMHAHGLDLKKTGAPLRIRRLVRRGRAAPRYDLVGSPASLRRRAMEWCVGWHFRILRTRSARWLLDRIPFALLGSAYSAARWVWRRSAANRFGNRSAWGGAASPSEHHP